MSENQIKELEDEIQSLHDSIENDQADIQIKREELKNLKDPKWKEKEEQKKVKAFLVKANVNLEKWSIEESEQFKNAYIEDTRVIAFSSKPKIKISEYQKVCFDVSIISKILAYYQGNYSSKIRLYIKKSSIIIFHDGEIWGYLPNLEEDDYDEEIFEDFKKIKFKKKTEIEKILELQELIDKAKNLIFAAQDIDCTIDYPYCKEIEIEKPNASMGKELSNVRSTLEWMDNKCWSYQRLNGKKKD